MEYDVTGTLKIDTEAFEKALKEAQSKINSFRKDLESLGNIAKEMGFPELKKSLDNIDKSLDDVKADFGKVEKSADNVTKSVENLKKKTDNATKSTENLKKATSDVATQGKKAEGTINTLDEYFDQATNSAKKLTEETKKTGTEIDKATKKLEKLKSEWNSAYVEYIKAQKDRNKLGERVRKEGKDVGKKEFEKYKEYYYEKKDTAEAMKWLEKYSEKNKEFHKQFDSLYAEFGEKIGTLGKQIEQYELEIYKLQDSLERIPNSFDKIIESSKEAGESVRWGLLQELQKAEKKLMSLYEKFNLKKSKITELRDGELFVDRDYRVKKTIANDPQFKKLRSEINKQKWYIDDLIKEWDKLGEPSKGLDKKISKLEKWTEALREAEMERARLRVNADSNSVKTDTRDYYEESSYVVPRRKELDVIRETLAKYDKSFEKMSLKARELKEEGSKTGYSNKLQKEWDKLDKKSSDRLRKMTKEVNEYHKELESATGEVKKSGKGLDSVGKSAERLKEKTEEVNKSVKKTTESASTLDECFDQATASVKKLGKETKQVTDAEKKAEQSAKTLDEYFDKATASAKKLNTEVKEVNTPRNQLKKELEDISKKVDKAKQKLKQAENEWGKTWDSIRAGATGEELEKLTAKEEKQRKTVSKLRAEYQKLQGDMSKVSQQLQRMPNLTEKGINKNLAMNGSIRTAINEIKKGFVGWEEVFDVNKLYKNVESLADKYHSEMNRMTIDTDLLKAKMENLIRTIRFSDTKLGVWGNDALVLRDEARTTRRSANWYKSQGNMAMYEEKMAQARDYADGMSIYTKRIANSKKELQSLFEEYVKLAYQLELVEKGEQRVASTGETMGEKISEGISQATSKASEFDRKMKEQFDGLNEMLVDNGTFTVEQVDKIYANVKKTANNSLKVVKETVEKAQSYMQSVGKYGGFSQMVVRKQDLKRGIASLKGLIEERNRLNAMWRGMQGSSANPFTARGMSKAELERQYKKQFNRYGAGFLGDANIQKDIQKVNEFHKTMRDVSASTNRWVNEEITGFNQFSKAVQTSTMEAENRLRRLEQTFNSMSTVGFRNNVGIGQLFSGTGKSQNMKKILEQQLQTTGVGFAGTKDFQNLNRQMQEYNRLSNVANLNMERMGLGFEKFGQYSQKATSNIRSLSGVLRTLRTTMSMIGGMFVWEFAFRIMDSARATISAKSEMESYYKTLNMGSTEIASFNKQLDKTVGKFQKMNKFQLGETISALGVEFKMSTQEMNQIMKVAPMIVNEYLRAGRSTEEAILAIKDISQGEFLRLSRETGVGKKEIKEAGWSGDNKDIVSLYKALEKIGTARHWDVFASKAQSLNDVMLITENRMTEFMTLLSDAITPIIVTSFNALGSAFNSASKWYESLPVADKIYAQLTVLGGVVLTTTTVFNNHLLPAIQNFGNTLVSSFLSVDSAIVKEKGLAQAIAHETAVERIANIERANGQRVLNAKIMTLKSEELANKLGMSTTKLRTRYEKLQNQALRISEEKYKARSTAERMDILVNEQGMAVEKARTKVTKARTLAQRSLILAEEQGITTTQAMTVLMEEEVLAEMGTLKALMVRKLGLDATIVSEQGMVVALNERLAQSIPYISSLVAETLATIGLESATLTLVATLGLLLAPLIALGVAITPLIVQFAELQSSYERVNDVLTSGQERIDSLVEKKKSLEKTEQSLAEKTNRTTQENQKLNQTRQDLEATTLALKSAEEELAEAQKFDDARSSYTTKVEANRYKNLQEINKELKTNYGVNEDVLSQTASMDKAYRDMTKHMQVANWLENHRIDRFEEFNKRVKEGSSTQEEYNQKIKDLGNEWNMAYTDMEDAQKKMTDPELSGWDRFWTNMDYHFAKFKVNWVEFLGDPLGEFSQFESNIKLGNILPIMTPLNDMKTGDIFNGVKNAIDKAGKGFGDWLNTTANDWGQKWDDFWQPIRDFFDGLSVDTSYDPFSGVKEWWSSTNDWLESLLPDISVDDIKEWVRTKIKEPFQKAFSEFMKNPFGSSDKEQQNGGTAKKTISLSSMFNFNFGAFKSSFTTKFRNVFSGASDILQNAGQLWSRLTGINASKVVQSTKEGLSNLKGVVSQKFEQGKQTISSFASKWGRSAYSTGSSIYNNLKNGIGDLKGIIKDKFNGIKEAIDGVKKKISGSVQAVADAITSPFENIHLPFGFGGLFGYGNVYGHRPHKNRRIRVKGSSPTPAFGSSNIGFETVLRTMLTSQGFRSPSSYQFYPNHQKTTQEAWDSGKANCFDGASLILALGSMFGLKGHLVMGDWNGTGHTGAVVGGKLYDMTQFQRRGVFRGTSGVHFGSRQGKTYGNGQMKTTKVVNINVTNDLSNARIYGIDDLDNHIEKATERTFYRLNSVDGALGY